MPIVMISEPLLQRATATDGRILRDRVLSGFGVRLNARRRTFLIATSVSGKQFRMMLGHWPLMSVDEARSHAMEVLRQCRSGKTPSRHLKADLPTMREAYEAYCKAKGIKASSQKRYESFFRTHFGDWLDQPVSHMGHAAFASSCHDFAQSNGSALVELGRGVIGALIKYVNAVHGLELVTPFTKLAAAGLMPARSQPRARRLQIEALAAWKLGLGDAVLRRILNHTAPKTDVLHRHYVGLSEGDVAVGLLRIQTELTDLMRKARRAP